ncbi:hypothetical protein B7C42_06056 [Nocardia cerradoensis]|uniref:Uncharacterized protein n=1 Tax=Nocardia cerradoensis TaxID=85688 RepID=A0A231GYL6_9NOCA|nr:hypothetical protein B7C42_06056 [Nocardia cerradoensis]
MAGSRPQRLRVGGKGIDVRRPPAAAGRGEGGEQAIAAMRRQRVECPPYVGQRHVAPRVHHRIGFRQTRAVDEQFADPPPHIGEFTLLRQHVVSDELHPLAQAPVSEPVDPRDGSAADLVEHAGAGLQVETCGERPKFGIELRADECSRSIWRPLVDVSPDPPEKRRRIGTRCTAACSGGCPRRSGRRRVVALRGGGSHRLVIAALAVADGGRAGPGTGGTAAAPW